MTAILPERLAELDTITISNGSHTSRDDGMCVMELVSWLANEPHSDHPKCTCPVITKMLVSWNDNLPTNTERDRLLKPIVPTLIGTAATGDLPQRRSLLALDWLIREHLPAWLDAAKLTKEATALRSASPIMSLETAKAIRPLVIKARDKAAAAGAAAGDAARAAARDAARDAAGDAARAAARDAARDAAWAAAGAAAGDAAWAAAGAAAWDAAWAAARAAARDAARAALRGKVYSTVYAAARKVLDPVVSVLQQSAIALVARMVELR